MLPGQRQSRVSQPWKKKIPSSGLSLPPPPEAQPRLPPEGSRWPRGCARCGGGFPVLLGSCAPASPGVKRENKTKTKKKSKIDIAGFRHFGSGRIPPVRPCRAAPRQCKLGAFHPQKSSSQSSKKRSCWARGPASAPPVRGDFKARLRSDFSPYFRQCFPPIYAVIFPSFQAVFLPPLSVFLPPLSNVFPFFKQRFLPF